MSEIKNQRENSQKQSSESKTLQETDFTLPTGALEKTLSAFPPERANELISIIKVLREKRPEFIHAFETNADKSLEQYISNILTTATIPSPRLQGALASAISRHIPDIDSASLVRELQKGVLIDTSGHCGLLGDTESIHSLLLLAIAARQRGDSHIFAFAGGGVPLSNATFPGGFFWNGQRVSLHPKKISGQSSGSMTAATVEACVLKTILQTSPKYKGTSDEHGFPSTLEAVPHERQDFAAFLREEISSPNSQLRDLFTNHDLRFCDQVARINETLWSQLNTTHQGLPKLAYGLVEDVNRDVLQQLLIKESGVRPEDSQEPVYRLLFDPNLRNQVLDAFNPPDSSAPVVQGAWMHDETGAVSYGTHLFWLLEGVPHLDPFTGKQSVKNARK